MRPLLPVLGFLAACDAAPVPVSEWVNSDGYRYRALVPDGVAEGRFAAMSARTTGIRSVTQISEERRLENRTLVHGTGVALGDVDGDGWVDVYLCRLDRPNVLYRNLGGWRFEDVTEGSGAALADRLSRGAVMADADGDGDLDLFVSVHGAANALLLNDGSGRFVEREAGFVGAYGSNTVALADIDGDGDLDAYFANYKTRQGDDLFSPTERALQGQVQRVGDDFVIAPPYDEHYKIELVEGRSLRFELADPDEFYLNDGTGRFDPIDLVGGVFRGSSGEAPIPDVPRDWGLVARFFDADDDGDPDLYVANDFGSRDGFWINQGGWFRAASGLELRTTSASSMGIDFADIDGDGDTDFITTEMLALDPIRRREQAAGAALPRTPPGRSDLRAPVGRNTLQLNRGDGTYAEVAQAAGVAASEWTWGAMFLDVDLDGFEDLLVTNGHAWDPLDGDTQEALRAGTLPVDWRRELGVFPPLLLRNLAFRNRGDGTFESDPEEWRFGTEPDISQGIAAADLDRDGDRDVIITRLGEPPLVLRNDAGRARVAVRVLGRGGNTRAIGARVELEGGAGLLQVRQVTAGGMYLSGSDPLLVFAMAEADSATLTVVWPSGERRVLTVHPNTAYEIDPPAASSGAGARVGGSDTAEPDTAEADAAELARIDAETSGADAVSASPALFEGPISIGRHLESQFDELARQPLIPLELSRAGPGVSWEDVDGDGDPDLLVSAGAGARAQLARSDGSVLLDPVGVGRPSEGDQTTILAVPMASGTALIAGVSSWEARTLDDLDRIAPLARLSRGGDFGVPSTIDATGPLASADVDGDGDLDLFVGGRAIPGAYPRPASSRILLNEGDHWVVDPGRSAALREIGLVSGAVFSDVDGDGDPDLLLAVEWGPVRLLLNETGRLVDGTKRWGLASLSGRWNGVATGDLNADGRPDLVVTSWGTNTGRVATPERPAGVFAADLDGNGIVDIIEYETDETGAARPVRDYRTLSSSLPLIRRVAPTFERFARATVAELLAPASTSVYEARAVTLEHTVFINRDGAFDARPLPAHAQLAPAFGVVIADFDRDGIEDVFLAQNYLATPEGLGRHDAGRGEILVGDGQGGFAPLSGAASGVYVYGDARGAAVADFDGDGRWDLAVGQNGQETAVFHGAGGVAGLRVRLEGTAANPNGVGASIRIVYGDGAGEGPAREVQAGSGYWSSNGVVQVFGLRAEPRSVRVRWPGGREESYAIPAGRREVVLRPGRGPS